MWRSGFLPKALAALLTIAALGWLASSLTALIAPSLSPVVRPITSIATSGGELPVIFWLLIMGARPGLPMRGLFGVNSAPAGG